MLNIYFSFLMLIWLPSIYGENEISIAEKTDNHYEDDQWVNEVDDEIDEDSRVGSDSAIKLKWSDNDSDWISYKDFKTPYTLVWRAVLESLKNYPLQFVNKFSGQIQTRWMDSSLWQKTIEDNEDAVIRSKIFAIIHPLSNKEISRVFIYKRQHEYSEDEDMWYPVSSDGILEEALFYRIDQILKMQKKVRVWQKESKNK